jgi:hypothetical protein
MKMKLLTRTLSLLLIASLTLFFANCGGDDPAKSKEEVQLGKLKKTWNIVSAELDNVDRTADFTGFTLAFSGTYDKNAVAGDYPYDYSVGGSRPDPSPWPANGSWEFGGDPETLIIRDDGIGIVYSINSNGQLTMQFTCPDGGCQYPGSRTAQVEGNWEFVLD